MEDEGGVHTMAGVTSHGLLEISQVKVGNKEVYPEKTFLAGIARIISPPARAT